MPLGIHSLLKNETRVSDVVDILDEHHYYVPSSSVIEPVTVLDDEDEYIRLDSLHTLLYFGDQLTVERMRGAKAVRSNSENQIQQLKGFIPAICDWHAEVSFLSVSQYNVYNNFIFQ